MDSRASGVQMGESVYYVGQVANGHVWTGRQWVPLDVAARSGLLPPGTVMNGYRWDGYRWVALTPPAPPPAARPRPPWTRGQKITLAVLVALSVVGGVLFVVLAAMSPGQSPGGAASPTRSAAAPKPASPADPGPQSAVYFKLQSGLGFRCADTGGGYQVFKCTKGTFDDPVYGTVPLEFVTIWETGPQAGQIEGYLLVSTAKELASLGIQVQDRQPDERGTVFVTN